MGSGPLGLAATTAASVPAAISAGISATVAGGVSVEHNSRSSCYPNRGSVGAFLASIGAGMPVAAGAGVNGAFWLAIFCLVASDGPGADFC